MEKYRKMVVADKLGKLMLKYDELTVAQLLHTLLRKKNTKHEDTYFMEDKEILKTIEKMLINE